MNQLASRFPLTEFTARHGRRIALISALLAGTGSIVGSVHGGGAATLAVGLSASIVLYLALRLAAELIEVIAETLLPR